jgi:phenylpropionate dioxygenase-like ring-hydroxylating dioxygenase large terminal subunit
MTMKHWLKGPYQGYHRKHDMQADLEITQVGPGTPGGEYLRRAWQPVALSEEVQDLPLLVKILGEELVLFRTTKGAVGLVEKHCAHRRTSLEYGIATDRGIRCCYHGWHYAPDGTILETPNSPENTNHKKFCHGAYPVEEYKGIIFAFMGPPDELPDFPILDTYNDYHDENSLMVPYSLYYPCNWLQIAENTQDPVHSCFLHTKISGTQFDESWGVIPVIDWVRTPLGMMNVNVRRWKDNVWLRTTETILPNYNQAGAFWERPDEEKAFQRIAMARFFRPIDDTQTQVMGWRYFNDSVDPEGKGDATAVGKDKMDAVGQLDDRDRESQQRAPGDYEAIISQGPVAIHERETWVSTDRGIGMMRRLVRDGIRAVRDREPHASIPLRLQGAVPTFTQDSIISRPPLDGVDDDKVIREYGKRYAQILLESASVGPGERRAYLQEKLDTLIVKEL